MPNTFGVDLGTRNLKIFNQHTGRIITEKNTIAVVNRDELYAYGDMAYAMYEKAPEEITVSFPISCGVIADYNNMEIIIEELLERSTRGRLRGLEFIVSVPTDITEVEKKAFFDLFYKSSMRPKDVLLCDKPIADCLGLGLDVNGPDGIMVVDLGADTTEISIVSLGGLVLSELQHFGGNLLDEYIVSFVKKNFNLVIGRRTACQLKEEIGSALPDQSGSLSVIGIDVVKGIPIEQKIDASMVYEAMKDSLTSICNSIRLILEKTPPEVLRDIVSNGIYLTGGCSKVKGLDQLFTEITNINVNTCEDPEETVVRGLSLIATNDRYSDLAYSMKTRIFR